MSAVGTALVTGANRGLGLGLTAAFLAGGWRVFAGCRTPADAALLQALPRGPGTLSIVALDVRSDDSVTMALREVAQASGVLDVLVNNAGINPAPRELGVADIPASLVAETFDVNLLGALRTLQAVLPLLRRSARPRVVNVSSGAGSLAHSPPHLQPPAYCVSKAALNMLTRRAARELTDIVIVSVSPGWIRTDMGGPDGELGLEEAALPLAATIEGLTLAQSGSWVDRFGRPSMYAW